MAPTMGAKCQVQAQARGGVRVRSAGRASASSPSCGSLARFGRPMRGAHLRGRGRGPSNPWGPGVWVPHASSEDNDGGAEEATMVGERDAGAGAAVSSSSPVSTKWLAPAGVALGATLFVLSRVGGGVATLDSLARESVPLDVALSNGRPSVVEFYADWCEVCKSLAKDSGKIKSMYGDRVNFVMLNVDNPKWAEEVAEYRVGGIPHWEYLGPQGDSKGFVVGNLPSDVLAQNADALAKGGAAAKLPFVRRVANATPLQAPSPGPAAAESTMPRDHG